MVGIVNVLFVRQEECFHRLFGCLQAAVLRGSVCVPRCSLCVWFTSTDWLTFIPLFWGKIFEHYEVCVV